MVLLDAKGLALCGLALCTADRSLVVEAKAAYAAARAIISAKGVVGRVLQLFDGLAVADTSGLLLGVREVAGGQRTTAD